MLRSVLIVTPLKEEYDDLFKSLASYNLKSKPDKIGRLDVHRFPELNVTLARGGHGKTQFGIQTQYLLDQAQFDLVVCAGTAGALAPAVQVGDLIVATYTLEHDYNLKFARRPHPKFAGDAESIRQLKALNLTDAGFNVHFGIMASGDEDVIDVKRGAELYKAHRAIAVAWEGIGGARACAFSEAPYIELRGATDTADHAAPVVFAIHLKTVMKNIAHLLVRWLKA